MGAEKLSVQERFNRYYEAKMLLFTGQVAANPALTTDPSERAITPKTGLDELRDRREAFTAKVTAMSVVRCDEHGRPQT